MRFQPDRKHRLLGLAFERPFLRQVKHPHELLCDGAAALPGAAAGRIANNRSR